MERSISDDEIWEQIERPISGSWVVRFDRNSLHVSGADESGGLYLSRSKDCEVVFFGKLFPESEIFQITSLDLDAGERLDSSKVICAAYEQHGSSILSQLEGNFALILWDKKLDCLLAARDPVGIFPLFYTEQGNCYYFSTSIRELINRPNVRKVVNRTALVSFITFLFLSDEDTFFESVHRVPVSHALRIRKGQTEVIRYWDAVPDNNASWVSDEQLHLFNELLSRAVSRVLYEGPSAIYLSGGFDSVSIAAYATELAVMMGQPLPLALSLIFPHPEAEEETIQRSVASQLGIEQIIKPVNQVVGERGLVGAMLKLSASTSAPLSNFWLPAYLPLAVIAAKRGYQSVMNGSGGDEWLTVSPYYTADMLRRGNLAEVVGLLATYYRSSNVGRASLTKMVLWSYGLRPLIGRVGSAWLQRISPEHLRQRRLNHWENKWADWVAPDSSLRIDLSRQIEQFVDTKLSTKSNDSFYFQDGRLGLEHPLVTMDREEEYELGQRTKIPVRSPYWDSSLVSFLFKIHPNRLNQGMRSKGLVRETLALRFPTLGFERQKKVSATGYFQESVGPALLASWREIGGFKALADMGIVNQDKLNASLIKTKVDMKSGIPFWQLANILTSEVWLRHNL